MAMTGTVTLRLDADLKHQAEIICEEMGLTMSSAITIFIKRLVNDRAIPFQVAAKDPFYNESNLKQKIKIVKHLRAAAQRMDSGVFETHDLIEAE